MNNSLILASASPRRRQILTDLGVNFRIRSADIDESVRDDEQPNDYVCRLAREKCQHVFDLSDRKSAVLGSDTSVVIGNEILGKPSSEQDAIEMLMKLSGRWHQVMTAIAMISDQKRVDKLVISNVEFCDVDESMCRTYWHTGEPVDKAGGYAIQGIGSRFVKQIQGSYSAVVGLPCNETAELLAEFGIETWNFNQLKS